MGDRRRAAWYVRRLRVTEVGVGRLLEQVKAMCALLMAGDAEALRRWYAPDVEVVSRDGRLVGVDAVVDRYRQTLADVSFEAIRTTWSVEDDDTIAVVSLVEFSAGGSRVALPVLSMLRFDDDVVVAEHEYFDQKDIERQLSAQSSAG
jgi:predicted ester cyclase